MFGGWLYGNYYPFLCKQLEEIRKHNFKTTYTSNSKSSFPNTTPRRPTIRPLVIFFYLKTIDIPLFHWRVLTDIYTEFLENLVSIQSMHLGLSLHQLILYISQDVAIYLGILYTIRIIEIIIVLNKMLFCLATKVVKNLLNFFTSTCLLTQKDEIQYA